MTERGRFLRQWIVTGGFFARRNRSCRRIEKGNQRREHVAEHPGNAEGHVHPRASERGWWQNFDAVDPTGRLIVNRTRTHQMQCLTDIFAAIAQRCGAPEIENQMLRPVTMALQMMTQHLFARCFPKLEGRRCRHGARIGGIKIAPGRQHIQSSARRCTRGAWHDMMTVQRRQQRRPFLSSTFTPQGIRLII